MPRSNVRKPFAKMGKRYRAEGRDGCVSIRRSRLDKVKVGLYNAYQADFDGEGGPWVTVCEEHGTVCNHQTLTIAKNHQPRPSEWCHNCRKNTTMTTEKTQDRFETLRPYRFEDNPLEKKILEAFKEHCLTYDPQGTGRPDSLDYLFHEGDQRYVPHADPELRKAACSVIQWLGSPVGRSFLRDLAKLEVEHSLVLFSRNLA